MSKPLIVGHRGAAGLAPENTLAGFRTALELGVRCIELDVRLTRDAVPVCFHDDRLDRVTSESGAVAERDWAELRDIPVLSSAFGGAYPDARIPTLAEVVASLPEDVFFLVELKAEPVRPFDLVQLTLGVLREHDLLKRCRVISFSLKLLQLFRALDTDAKLGIIASAGEAKGLVSLAAQLGAEAVHAQHPAVDEGFVREAHDAGFLVSAWTVNTEDELRRLAALGVDEIASDYPDLALKTI